MWKEGKRIGREGDLGLGQEKRERAWAREKRKREEGTGIPFYSGPGYLAVAR